MQELSIGAFGVSIVLSVLLRLLYNTFEFSNRVKPWIAVSIGVALGVIVMYYNLAVGTVVGFKMIVDYVLYGFMTGATAVGMYEMTKKST